MLNFLSLLEGRILIIEKGGHIFVEKSYIPGGIDVELFIKKRRFR